MYTNLLQRQIKRNLKDAKEITPQWSAFLDVVNRSYEHYERDHSLTQHSLNISSKELAQKEIRISSIIAAAADGILVINSSGKVEICNRAVTAILGIREKKIIYESVESFIQLVDSFNQKVGFQDLIKELDSEKEYFVKRQDATTGTVAVKTSKSQVFDEVLYIVMIRDITEKKKHEKEIQKLNDELVAASRMIGMGEMASSMLHNIGNLLNSILVSIQILKDTTNDNKIRQLSQVSGLIINNINQIERFFTEDKIGKMIPEYLAEFVKYLSEENLKASHELESLHTNVKYIHDIIRTQQAYTKSGIMIEEFDVNACIEEALKICSSKQSSISVLTNYGNLLPIRTDKIKMLQILVNIINNAFESIVLAGKEIKMVEIKTSYGTETSIKIEVKDNGVGISPDNLTRIFTSGFTTKTNGNGIGLHSSAIFTQHLGGQITAKSEGINKGATFTITLPFTPPQEKDNA